MAGKVVAIDAWAVETGAANRQRRCAVCVLPPDVLAEITRGWNELGYRAKVVLAYLEAAGYRISQPMLAYHFTQGKHGEAR